MVEVHLDDLDDDTRKFVENEVGKVSLPENYKQTLGKLHNCARLCRVRSISRPVCSMFVNCVLLADAARSDSDRQSKQAHGRCAFLRDPQRVKHTCDVCGFATTEMGLQKHRLRNHPSHFFMCEVGPVFRVENLLCQPLDNRETSDAPSLFVCRFVTRVLEFATT